MDTRYLDFATADPFYYEPPRSQADAERYRPADTGDWADWTVYQIGWSWIAYRSPGGVLPAQGWKIHVSATHHNAQRLLDVVSGYCYDHRIGFKHLPSSAALLHSNMKYADRGGSGKFITIYPAGDQQTITVLDDLDALIGGEPGPYILSDLRWNDGPLYVRYGAFLALQVADADGLLVPAIAAPDGTLHPDHREPRVIVPDWVSEPDEIAQQRAALRTDDADRFPYRITAPLHYSNGGGVYRARDRGGNTVVLKEARPYAGITPDLRDAVARLRHEEDILQRLAGVPGVERHLGGFDFHGHRFAVLASVPGIALSTLMAQKTPAIRSHATPEDYREYRDWALGMAARIETTLDGIHAAGICHGDLHPNNILVHDDAPIFIDFEAAHLIDDHCPPILGAPGYVAPGDRQGIDRDRYALACLKLSLFAPMTMLLPLDAGKARQLLDWADERYHLPAGYRDQILAELGEPVVADHTAGQVGGVRDRLRQWDVDHPHGLAALQQDLAAGIVHTADFTRTDRAFPGDIALFAGNAGAGYGLAHGAAGVLVALQRAGQPVPAEALGWLTSSALADTHPQPGLLNGLGGVVWALRELGEHRTARLLTERLLAIDTAGLGMDLATGLPGYVIGYYLNDLAEPAEAAARELADRWDQQATGFAPRPSSAQVATGRGGLLRGPSGIALAALWAYRRSGDARHLDVAEGAVRADMARCIRRDDGSLQMNEGWRSLPYFGSGSAGVGIAILELVPHVDDADRYLDALDGILIAAQTDFVIQPGLAAGRAGLMLFLARAIRYGFGGAAARSALRHHARELRLHALRHGPGIVFPGDQLLRISSDLATGTAGVMLALDKFARLDHDTDDDSVTVAVPGDRRGDVDRVPARA